MKIRETLAAEFDQFSDNYTEVMIRCVPHYQRLLSSLSECLPDDFSAESILDLGCGSGNATALLLKKFPNAEYTLLDASSDMLDLCRSRFPGANMTYHRGYFREYAFPESHFDLVVAGFSLHHLDSSEKQWIFPLLHKTLKQGGLLTCSDLMVTRNTAEHEQFLREWQAFINASYPDGEKWAWMVEHHEAYDRPDAYADQKSWLLDAGFSYVDARWREGHWMHFIAGK